MKSAIEASPIAYPEMIGALPSTAQRPRQARISVCHLASGDGWGGAEAQLVTLITALSQQPDLALCAIVLNEGRLAEELRRCAIDVKVIPEQQKSFWQIATETREFLRARNIQILHTHRYKENFIAALLAFADPRVRLIKTQHGRTETLAGLAGVKQWLAHTVDRLTMRYADDAVISVSSQLTGYLEKYINRNRIVVIPNAIDLARVSCELSRAEAKKHLGIPEDAPFVGFLGRLERVKRLDIFARAAQEIVRELPETRFVIVGRGREEKSLRQLIAELGLEKHVTLLGHREDTNAILRAMDLLLITSDHEGLPMVLLEAMALGTTVVAAKVGGIAEVLTHGKTGFLVEDRCPASFARVCVAALQDPATTQRLAWAARELVECRYLADGNSRRVCELYASFVDVGKEYS